MLIWNASRSLRLTGTDILLAVRLTEKDYVQHALKNLSNFLDCEKSSGFSRLSILGQATKPSTEKDRKDHILYISSPTSIVSMHVSTACFVEPAGAHTCNMDSLKLHLRAFEYSLPPLL